MSYNNYYITGYYPNNGHYNHEIPINISLVGNGRFINCIKCGRQYYHDNLSYNCPFYEHFCPFCGLPSNKFEAKKELCSLLPYKYSIY